MTVQSIFTTLASQRFPISTEALLQEAMHAHLVLSGIEAEREIVLSQGNRIDIFIASAGVGIECKIKGSKREIYRQVERYCEHDQIEALILATNVAMGMPAEVCGKPVYVLNLAKAWL